MDNVIAFQRRYLEEHGDKLDKIERHANQDKVIQAAQLFATYKDLKDNDKLVNKVEGMSGVINAGLLSTEGDGVNSNIIKMLELLKSALFGSSSGTPSTPIDSQQGPLGLNSPGGTTPGFFNRMVKDTIEYIKINSRFENIVNSGSKGLSGFLIDKELSRRAGRVTPVSSSSSPSLSPMTGGFQSPIGSSELEEENIRLMNEQNEAIRRIDEQTKPIPEVLDVLKNGSKRGEEDIESGSNQSGIFGSLIRLFTGFGASLATAFSSVLASINGFAASVASAAASLLSKAGGALATGARAIKSTVLRTGSAAAGTAKRAWDVLKGTGAAGKIGTSVLGKVALPVTAALAAYDGYSGYTDANKILGIEGREATFGEKLSASAGSVFSGLSFGFLDKANTSASIARFFGAGPDNKIEVGGVASKEEFINNYVTQRVGDNSFEGKSPEQVQRIIELRKEAERIIESELRMQKADEQSNSGINETRFLAADPIGYNQFVEYRNVRSAQILSELNNDNSTISSSLSNILNQSNQDVAFNRASAEAAVKFKSRIDSAGASNIIASPARVTSSLPPSSGDTLYQRSVEVDTNRASTIVSQPSSPTVISAPTSVTNNTSINTSRFPRNPDSSYQNYNMGRFRPEF